MHRGRYATNALPKGGQDRRWGDTTGAKLSGKGTRRNNRAQKTKREELQEFGVNMGDREGVKEGSLKKGLRLSLEQKKSPAQRREETVLREQTGVGLQGTDAARQFEVCFGGGFF